MKNNENIQLDIKDLHIYKNIYKGSLRIVKGVNLSMRHGEKIGLIGESGCGKSTTVRAIVKMLYSRNFYIPQGQIIYEGRDILKMNSKEIQKLRSREIAIIFQDPNTALNPFFTIGNQMSDIIKYTFHSNNDINKKKDLGQKIIKEISINKLKEVFLPDPERILSSYPFQLSGGMKQRVCIAMAIISTRKIIIADEPGASLDVTIQDQIIKLLKHVAERSKTSIILVTHSMGLAREMADRIYVMYAGTIVESAHNEKIFANPVHPYTKGLIASVPKLSGHGIGVGIPGSVTSYINSPSGCRFHSRCEFIMPICTEKPPQMFEIEKEHWVACHLYKREKISTNE